MSRPLQVYLEDADYEALEQLSKERGWSMSQTVRVALRALTNNQGGGQGTDPLLAASGMIDGLPADLSQRFDQNLAMTFVAAEPVEPYRAGPSGKRRARKPVRR